jgi:hypothetical protein
MNGIEFFEAKSSLGLVDDWVSAFERKYGFIAADTGENLTKIGRGFQKGDVSAMHHVKTS